MVEGRGPALAPVDQRRVVAAVVGVARGAVRPALPRVQPAALIAEPTDPRVAIETPLVHSGRTPCVARRAAPDPLEMVMDRGQGTRRQLRRCGGDEEEREPGQHPPVHTERIPARLGQGRPGGFRAGGGGWERGRAHRACYPTPDPQEPCPAHRGERPRTAAASARWRVARPRGASGAPAGCGNVIRDYRIAIVRGGDGGRDLSPGPPATPSAACAAARDRGPGCAGRA